jgi:hypothetical protein
LAEFARVGGKIIIIGRAPTTAPGLKARGEQDQIVQATMQRMLSDHPTTCRVVAAPAKGEDLLAWFQRVRGQCGLVPDVAFAAASPHVSQTFHKVGGRDVFFVVNSSREQAATVQARFRTSGRTPWAWDAETGIRRVLPWDDAPNVLTLRLAPAESRLIVFENAIAEAPAREVVPAETGAVGVAGVWQVELRHMDGSRREVSMEALRNLGELDGLAGFAGQATYRLKFSVSDVAGARFLDFGAVREISEVTLNGAPLGVRWYGRHLYAFPSGLRANGNELEIRVTTISGNYAKSLTANETAQRWTKNLPARPMGLLGPVRLLAGQ